MDHISKSIETTLNDSNNIDINVGVSSRHIHLSQAHIDILFPNGLTNLKDLTQPGQFACNECVDIVGPKRTINGVRILGPARGDTQIEISKTDSFYLGVDAPIRMSGKIENTPGCKLVSEFGEIALDKGIIIAKRHIHMHPIDAKKIDITDGENVWVVAKTQRSCIIGDVIVRVKDSFSLDFHIDTDEANAFWLKNSDKVRIVR